MVKRFRIKYVYETSDDTITEEQIRKNLNPIINTFDTIKAISIDEI